MKWLALTLLALLLVLAGCVDIKPTAETDTDLSSQAESGCTAELGVHLTPWEPNLKVGEKVTLRVELSTCGGLEHLTDTYTWTSKDTSVAVVNPATGLLTARAPGQVWLHIEGAKYGNLGDYRITVIGE